MLTRKAVIWSGDCFVHKGPAAIRVGEKWLGYASGNRPCAKLRVMAKAALNDACRLEEKK